MRIAIAGPLDAIMMGLTAGAVGSVFLVRDARGQAMTLPAMQKRFDKLGVDW